jgi:hypothetical protein
VDVLGGAEGGWGGVDGLGGVGASHTLHPGGMPADDLRTFSRASLIPTDELPQLPDDEPQCCERKCTMRLMEDTVFLRNVDNFITWQLLPAREDLPKQNAVFGCLVVCSLICIARIDTEME